MRTLKELLNAPSCWSEIELLIKEASNKVDVLPKDKELADAALLEMQESVDTWVGAIIYETGGILIDNGWLRILGSGDELIKRSLLSWNKGKTFDTSLDELPFLLVADDVLGGLFAINAGGFGEDVGGMYYFAPDMLEWEEMELTYDQFLYFCFSGDLKDFYGDFRWISWQDDVKSLSLDEAFHLNPPLYSSDFSSIEKVDKTSISVDELYEMNMEMAEAMDEEE